MTKKRKLLLAITALLLLSAAFVLFVPRRCLPNGCNTDFYNKKGPVPNSHSGTGPFLFTCSSILTVRRGTPPPLPIQR